MPGKRSNAIAPDKGMALFSVLGYSVMAAMALICLLPFWLMITGSFSDEHTILRRGFSILPRGFSLEAYRSIFRGSTKILRAYRTTIGITVVGTLASLTLTSMAGYVLQRPDFRCRNALSFFVYFTTLFSGGLIPWYILIVRLGMKNTLAALVIPALLSPWHIMLMRNFIRTIPISILEAAKIDGAGDWGIYRRIVLPLSKTGLAAIGLFIALNYWNNWYLANLFMKDESKYPLQYLLYQMLSSAEFLKSAASAGFDTAQIQPPTETLKLATAMVVTGPILLLYPFVQRFFVKGVTVGAVKG